MCTCPHCCVVYRAMREDRRLEGIYRLEQMSQPPVVETLVLLLHIPERWEEGGRENKERLRSGETMNRRGKERGNEGME